MDSLDIYASTNPALMGLVLWHFLAAHAEAHSGENAASGCELAVLYLPIPLAASEDIRDSFESTTKNTGLFTWLRRNPQLAVSVHERVIRARENSAKAIRFSTSAGLISPSPDGLFHAGPSKRFTRKPTYPASDFRGAAFRRAHKLGHWLARIGSTEMVFNTLGLST